MKFKTSNTLSEEEVESGLKYVIKDGLFTEAMITVTSGAFLVAMALKMGASNFQIGLIAALPTIANIFQLLSIWLVQKYNNRRAISVICSFFARFPLIIVGLLPLLFSSGTSMAIMIFLLFFHYFFGAVSGASWNAWMKDLVPESQLGTYFSKRTRLIQILSVVLSLGVAFILDHIKVNFPQYELFTYCILFMMGGVFGLVSAYMLYRTPEPASHLQKEQIFKLIRKPLKDKNFRKLLVFNSFWAFALNMATPFFSVYMMKTLGLSLSIIIMLNIVSQVSSILFVKTWGRYSDEFSNKTIISICAPMYIGCIISWSLTSGGIWMIPMLILIHCISGIAMAGINLSITNIGIKLAPQNEAIVYIAAKNMVTAFIPALAPVIGGLLADFFANHQLSWSFSWQSPDKTSVFHVLHLTNWSFFFVIGAILAMISLRFLKPVHEKGEVSREVVFSRIRRKGGALLNRV